MKKILLISVLVVVVLFLVVNFVFAQGLFKPFGGRITETTLPGVDCAAQYGVITITPVSTFPPMPYIITATTKTVSAGNWILGLYNPILTPGSCYTDSTPPVPFPTYSIKLFGVSGGAGL